MGDLSINNSTYTSIVPDYFVLEISDNRTHTFRDRINDLDILSDNKDLSFLNGNYADRRVYPDRNCVRLGNRSIFKRNLIGNH